MRGGLAADDELGCGQAGREASRAEGQVDRGGGVDTTVQRTQDPVTDEPLAAGGTEPSLGKLFERGDALLNPHVPGHLGRKFGHVNLLVEAQTQEMSVPPTVRGGCHTISVSDSTGTECSWSRCILSAFGLSRGPDPLRVRWTGRNAARAPSQCVQPTSSLAMPYQNSVERPSDARSMRSSLPWKRWPNDSNVTSGEKSAAPKATDPFSR
jgi:hypothetical protein